MTKRERERKIKMFGMIGMSVLVISSLATATYAWFTKVNVTASTGTMIVSTVEQTTWNFYAYNGNGSDGKYVMQNDFELDFTLIDDTDEDPDNDSSVLADVGELFAGDSVLFAIEVTGVTADTTYSVGLDLTEVLSTTWNNKHPTERRYAKHNSYKDIEVNIGWAMNIYTIGSPSNAAYQSDSNYSTDKFSYSIANGSNIASLVSSNPVSLISESALETTSTSIFLFYKIHFDDVGSGTLFTEKTNNSYTDDVPYPQTGAATRYFLQDENGNSNCFAGLDFKLKTLSLSVTKAS